MKPIGRLTMNKKEDRFPKTIKSVENMPDNFVKFLNWRFRAIDARLKRLEEIAAEVRRIRKAIE